MIKSMTGFGKAVTEHEERKLFIEIRSLNSKQLDISTKICRTFKEKESDIRSLVSKKIERGKVDIAVFFENGELSSNVAINKTLLIKYYEELKGISIEAKNNFPSDHFALALKMPDVMDTAYEPLSEEAWKNLATALNIAVDQLNDFRSHEGKILEDDLTERIKSILGFLVRTADFEANRLQTIRNRIEKNLYDLIGVEKTDKNRLEEEMIYYLEKIDISEEKVRLKKHCDYFLETMEQPEANGRKLAFISQEIGREINTMGSKANDADIQKLVVQMKDELEKIKEQLLNIL